MCALITYLFVVLPKEKQSEPPPLPASRALVLKLLVRLPRDEEGGLCASSLRRRQALEFVRMAPQRDGMEGATDLSTTRTAIHAESLVRARHRRLGQQPPAAPPTHPGRPLRPP